MPDEEPCGHSGLIQQDDGTWKCGYCGRTVEVTFGKAP